MNTLIIFGAKYLIFLSPILAAWVFYKASREKRREMIIFVLVSVPLALILFALARMVWFNPRPFMVSGVAPLTPHEPGNGFPSGHTLAAALFAIVVAYLDRKTAILLWIIAILVGVARVYAGVHHFADILASIIIVLVAKWIAYAIMHKLWNKHQANS